MTTGSGSEDGRRCFSVCAAGICGAVLMAIPFPALAQTVYSDGFESGAACTWSVVQTPELCFDGIDQDCDGALDLVDPECASTLCEPCLASDDCLAPTDLCLELDDGSYCGQDCSEGNPYGTPASECPTGYSCFDPGGMGASQCVPNTNACLCDGTNLSLRIACMVTVGETTCEGERSCTVSGWSACIPFDEQEFSLCSDGLDNDCDGSVDCDDPGCDGTPPCLVNGDPCAASFECLSGHCQNGFCCASGDCCSATDDCPPFYTLPSTCTSPSTCQGFRYDATCIANACASAPDADDTGCDLMTLSDGCGPFADVFCDGTADQSDPACPTACASNADCDISAYCNVSSVCVADLGVGQPCATSEQCVSGHCTDGVCCDSACDGLCESCIAASTGASDGTCGFVTAGTDPDAECGTSTCDGSGACNP